MCCNSLEAVRRTRAPRWHVDRIHLCTAPQKDRPLIEPSRFEIASRALFDSADARWDVRHAIEVLVAYAVLLGAYLWLA